MTTAYLSMGALIFACGLLGFLTRRNLILMFLSLELMLFGVSLNFIAFGNRHGDLGGQTFVVLILTVAACEAALALALIVALYRSRGSLDVNVWRSLCEADVADRKNSAMPTKHDDRPLPADGEANLPKLTPAGHDPFTFPVERDAKQVVRNILA